VKFQLAPIEGVSIVELEPYRDERGLFARTYCAAEFAQHGLSTEWPQCNISRNPRRFTLRGIHFAAPPEQEAKLVRCTRGAVYDLVLDLRAGSPTCFRWFALELTEENHTTLYIPPGVAHGFLTLVPDTEIMYHMGAPYAPEAARGVRWNDPRFALRWPHRPEVMSPRDAAWPDFSGEPLVW
jgi:dTDP-4-dehydrorhamnose 3,5-epimerase